MAAVFQRFEPLISAAILMVCPLLLMAQVNLGHTSSLVPFVGCRSDGQVGPLDPPQGSRVSVPVSAAEAEHLAYYKSALGIGVLAPRGWHCFGIYGSGSETLYVTADPINAKTVFSDQRSKFVEAAIHASIIFGETSGRNAVAGIIARVFPDYQGFVRKVVEMYDLPSASFPSGPYPADTLTYKGKAVVEYKTPAHRNGLGTFSWLEKNDSPIAGVAILVGESPDLLHLAVRLPVALNGLTSAVLGHFEREAATSLATKLDPNF